jgi:hypothetical protein
LKTNRAFTGFATALRSVLVILGIKIPFVVELISNTDEDEGLLVPTPTVPVKLGEAIGAFNAKAEQMAKRRELAKARRAKGMMGKGGLDLSHTKDGKLVKESVSSNRARNRGKK